MSRETDDPRDRYYCDRFFDFKFLAESGSFDPAFQKGALLSTGRASHFVK
jgi:hypothetical protein